MKRQREVGILQLPECVIAHIFGHLIAENTVSLAKLPNLNNAYPLAIGNSHLYCVYKRFIRGTKFVPIIPPQVEDPLLCPRCGVGRGDEEINSSHLFLHEYISKVELYDPVVEEEERDIGFCVCQMQDLLRIAFDHCPRITQLVIKDHLAIQDPPTPYMKSFYASGVLKGLTKLSLHMPFSSSLRNIALLQKLKSVTLSHICPAQRPDVGQMIERMSCELRDLHVTYDKKAFPAEHVLLVQTNSSNHVDSYTQASLLKKVLQKFNYAIKVNFFHVRLHEPGTEACSNPSSPTSGVANNSNSSTDQFQEPKGQKIITAEVSFILRSRDCIGCLVPSLPPGFTVTCTRTGSRSVVGYPRQVAGYEGCFHGQIQTLDMKDILYTYYNYRTFSRDGNNLIHDASTAKSIELHYETSSLERKFSSLFEKDNQLLDALLRQASKSIEVMKLFVFCQKYLRPFPLTSYGYTDSSDSAVITKFALRIVDTTPNLKILELDITFLFCLDYHYCKVKTFFSRVNSLEHLSITNRRDDKGFCFYCSGWSDDGDEVDIALGNGSIFLKVMPDILNCIRTFSKRFSLLTIEHGEWMERPSRFKEFIWDEESYDWEWQPNDLGVMGSMRDIWKEIALLQRDTRSKNLDTLIDCLPTIGKTLGQLCKMEKIENEEV